MLFVTRLFDFGVFEIIEKDFETNKCFVDIAAIIS